MCAYIAVGDSIQSPDNTYDLSLAALAVATVGTRVCDVIMDSGFRPKNVDDVADEHPELAERVEQFKQKYMYRGPLSLQKLAANVVRSRLKPNTVAGARALVKAGLPKKLLMPSLTLGLTERDMYKRRNWCPCTYENGLFLF